MAYIHIHNTLLTNKKFAKWCLFSFRFYVPVNSYGHVETVSSTNHNFSWARLTNRYFVLTLSLVTDIDPSWISKTRRIPIEIISRSNTMKVWDQARIELITPESAVWLATNCFQAPVKQNYNVDIIIMKNKLHFCEKILKGALNY